ncbi:hypothetical protein Csa_006960 [Cucumis sativus]|uniref:Uncharacterized protein n=1 Tax=Cucumis sativus TaxID=3659 RepID=A0A0A0M0D0_CUCSA|nr:hypothetical protein Csa_006960 [Cucumis sativus]
MASFGTRLVIAAGEGAHVSPASSKEIYLPLRSGSSTGSSKTSSLCNPTGTKVVLSGSLVISSLIRGLS